MLIQATADSLDAAADNGWTAVGVIGGAAAAAIVYGIVKLVSKWMTTHSEIQVDGERYDVTGMSPALVRMLDAALTRAAAAESSAAEGESHITELRTDVDDLKATRGLLVAEVAVLRKGVAEGTIPPLHPLDPRLVHLFPPDEI